MVSLSVDRRNSTMATSQPTIASFFGQTTASTATVSQTVSVPAAVNCPPYLALPVPTCQTAAAGLNSPPAAATQSSSSESATLTVCDQPNQPAGFLFPRRKFGEARPVYRSFQATWFKKWPWLHYDQVHDASLCFVCVKASKSANFKVCASKGDDAFLKRGFCNWKDACGEKRGAFATHERSHIHKYCMNLLSTPSRSVAEMLSSDQCKLMVVNRQYMRKVLDNVIFLARQGLAFRGNWVSDGNRGGAEVDSNFYQLLLLRAKDDPDILEVMQRKTRKYTDHHIQNELMQIMALSHLRKIAAMITESGYFTLESDEVTDASNHEQVIVCLRWVDAHLVAHEEFIGLHHVADITTNTVVGVLKDTVLRMNLNLSMCRGQCYDGAANMKKVAKTIKEIQPKALYLHCFGHSLNLAVSDTLKQVTPLSSTLDHSLEICKLVKFSPRRDAIFTKLKAELSPQVPGLRNLCPTRWTVRAASLESIRLNYPTLLATWEEAVDVVKQTEVKARISGVAAKMMEFSFLFSLMLAERLLKHCDNLSKTMQSTSMPAVEARRLSKLCVAVLEKIRGDSDFDLFWCLVLSTQKQLDVEEPVLQRRRKRPRRYEDGSAGSTFSDPKSYYRSVYYQCLDAAISTINNRFDQRDFSIYANLEEVLCKACSNEDFSCELDEVCEFFDSDFDKSRLETQLQMLSCMNISSSTSHSTLNFTDIHQHFQALSHSEVVLLGEVVKVIKLVLLMPATNAVSERSASAMRRIKSYLRSTMTQSRLNSVMVLHIHKHLTDTVNHIAVLNEFASANDDRRKQFGVFC